MKKKKERPEQWEYWPSLETELPFTCGPERGWRAIVNVHFNGINLYAGRWETSAHAKISSIRLPDGRLLGGKQARGESTPSIGAENLHQLEEGLLQVTSFFVHHLNEKMPRAIFEIINERQAAGTMKAKVTQKALRHLLKEIAFAWDVPRSMRDQFPPNPLLQDQITRLLELPKVLPFEVETTNTPREKIRSAAESSAASKGFAELRDRINEVRAINTEARERRTKIYEAMKAEKATVAARYRALQGSPPPAQVDDDDVDDDE
jgi:hypothetical protein